MNRNSTSFLKEEYEELVRKSFDWKLRILETGSTPHSVVDGKKVIMLCSNNYLNLSNHPRLIKSATDAAEKFGAGSGSVRAIAGTSVFDSAQSFALMRGGRLDATVLGGLQVSEQGDLANWTMHPEALGGPGGAADLCIGPKKKIVCMFHNTNEGEPRLVKECTLPLTGAKCVNLVITDIAVVEITKEGMVLKEYAPGWTVEEIQALTEPKLIIDKNLKEIELF